MVKYGTGKYGTFKYGTGSLEGEVITGASLSAARSLIAAYSVGPKNTVRAGFTRSLGPKELLGKQSFGSPTIPRVYTHSSTYTDIRAYQTGTYRGLSLIFRDVSIRPDLHAIISGWAESDILASILAIRFSSMPASIKVWQRSSYDLLASVGVFNFYNLQASLSGVLPSDISGSINPIYSYITASLNVNRAIDLITKAGGHLPENILASVFGVSPKDIWANIRGYLSGSPSDILSSIIPSGGMYDMSGFVVVTSSSISSIRASIRVREHRDFLASIITQRYGDISASISHNYASPPLRALIHPSKSVYFDIGGFIRRVDPSSSDTTGFVRCVISTHTDSRPAVVSRPNLGVYPRPFPRNRYIIGSRVGFTILTIEPLFGYFPDLRVSIIGNDFYKSSIQGFIWPFIPSYLDIYSSIIGTTPSINVSRVRLNYVLFRSLRAVAAASGGYLNMRASIRGMVSTSTGTFPGSGYTYSRSVTAQFFATSKGLLILPSVVSNIKRGTFVNNHPLPDLNGFLYGWDRLDMVCSIRVYPFSNLEASIFSWDLSHISYLPAIIRSQTPVDFPASIIPFGSMYDLGVSIVSLLYTVSFGASINGYPAVLDREIVNIRTKPISSLAATINFNSTYLCSRQSAYKELGASLVSHTAGFYDMFASITILRSFKDMGASIYGLKRIRLRLLSLYFRTKTRDSVGLKASINGWKRSVESDMFATLEGFPHFEDISASISVSRIKPIQAVTADDVLFVNVKDPSDTKTARIMFGSGVSHYIYDSGANEIYSLNGERWSILVQEQKISDEFFDKPLIKEVFIRTITDYDSFDEAVRAALVLLASSHTDDIGASISVGGLSKSLPALIAGSALDKVSDMPSGIFPVYSIPDISAYLNSSGGFGSISSSIKSIYFSNNSIISSVVGWDESNFSAEVVGVP